MTIERLFLALWPDDTVRMALTPLAIGAGAHGGRPIRPENLHLTLAFLGAVDAARGVCVEDVCAAVRVPAFELTLGELGWRAPPGIAWAAPAQTPEPLLDLVNALNAGLGRCGFVPETRPLRAHVTLARDVRRRIAPQRFTEIRWKVSQFCLVSSRLDSHGSTYTVRRCWPLA